VCVLFSSSSVLTSDSDVKELLPEFYMTSAFHDSEDDDAEHRQDGEFLLNQSHIEFGIRHDSIRVNDVILPPWAENTKDFVYKMRLALESDYVSQHLHEWIDLIFGYKQRGDEARQADNLFHYLTYGEPAQNSKLQNDFNEQLSVQTQILEFGQVPKQLFTKPHPRKLTKQELDDLEKEKEKLTLNAASLNSQDSILDSSESNSDRPRSQSFSTIADGETMKFEFDSVCRLHKSAITRIVPHPMHSSTHLLTISDDGFLRNYLIDRMKSEAFYLVSVRRLTCLKSIQVQFEYETSDQCSLAFIGSSDHTLYVYNLETGTAIFSQILHDDVITDLYITNQSTPTILCTSSNDATVRFWSLENLLSTENNQYKFQQNYHLLSKIEMQYDISFDTPCNSMHILEEHGLLAVGCQDGAIHLCHFQTGQILKQLSSATLPILSLTFRSDCLFLAYLTSTTMTLVDILSGTDVFTQNSPTNGHTFTSFFYASQLLIIGLSNGTCDIWNLKLCEKIHTLPVCDNIPITTITYNDGLFFFGTDDGSVHAYTLVSRH